MDFGAFTDTADEKKKLPLKYDYRNIKPAVKDESLTAGFDINLCECCRDKAESL